MRKLFICSLFLAIVAVSFAAPVENVLSFQGKIVEGGTPVDGARNITFRLYDVAVGGTHLWEETHIGVPVVGGLFNRELGATVTFEFEGVDFSEQYWIGISVGGGAELTPRYKLTSSPYAMNSVWEINGSDIYYDDGNVGIGTTTPAYPLQVDGSVSGFASDGNAVGSFVNTIGSADAAGVYGECAATANWGYGGYFKGGYRGVQGIATEAGTGFRYGVYGWAADGASSNYGLRGVGEGGATSYGIYASASGATTNWAGYFEGNVRVTGNLTVDGSYLDSDGDAGTAGQILSSTGTGTNWIAAGSGGGLWTDGGTYINPNDNSNIWMRDASQTRDIQVDITGGTKWYGLFIDNTATAYNGSSYREGFAKAAIAANVDNAGKRQCAIVGWSALTSDSSASVLGANTDGSVWGALGYKYGTDVYSAFFSNMTHLGNQVSIGKPTPTTSSELTIYDPITATIDIGNDDETWRITTPSLNNLHFHNYGGPSNVLVLEHGTGHVGINNTDPAITFHIKQRATSSNGIRIERSANTNHWDMGVATTDNLWFEYNGSLEAWIDHTDGTYTAVSDRRLKTEIEPMEPVLDKIVRLEPVNYYFKNDTERDHKSMGFIAQEVAEVFPTVAPFEEDFGFYGINYSYLSVLTLKGLIELNQEYQSTIENQETRLETLESQIELLKAEIESLKEAK